MILCEMEKIMAKALYIAEKPSVAQEFAESTESKHIQKGWIPGRRRYGGYLVCGTSGDHELPRGL